MISILISSTFNDMQAERDVIRSRVAPALRRVAAQYGQSVRLIDLRWGVNTADMSEEAAAQTVLETCLKEIDRCDGYMICLLGNRYGWVPDYSKLTALQDHGIELPHPVSVTELEIQYGILQRNRGEKSIVFLRDDVTGLPKELWSRYNDPAEDGRMAGLKAQLEALPQGSCEHYSLEYANGEFTGINHFAQRLIERASQLLHSVFGSECRLDEAQALKRKFDNIIQEHCETYLPHPLLEQELSSFGESTSSVLMLQGAEGSGRSAFLSRLANTPPAGITVIPYFCSEDTTGRDILSYFLRQLGLDTILLTSQRELEEAFSEGISQLDAPVWFAVDGLDLPNLEGRERLSWLPHHLPDNVRFVLTSVKQDAACNQLGESFYVQYFEMPPLTDAAGFIRAGLAAAGKAIPETILDKVAGHPLSTNYLFCDMVIRMLMLMDRHDFAVMNRDGGGIDVINAYILNKINHLPQTMAEMAFLFLYDCGEQITPGNTALYLSAIAQTPMGLRAQDLQELYPQNWDEAEFSYFTAFLDGFLVCNDNGCYTIPSGLMRHACLQAGEEGLLRKLAVYFATLPDNDPVKVGSALPMFLIFDMVQEAATLLLANPQQEALYHQLWNMLLHTRANVSALLNRDDVLNLFLKQGITLQEDRVRLTTLSEILKFRIPPRDIGLHRRMLLALAQLQLSCKDKRSAHQTLTALLSLETSALARAKTIVMITECSFVDQNEQLEEIHQLLREGLSLFPNEEALSPEDKLLLFKGLFYRHLFSLRDALGVSVQGAWTYADFVGKPRGSDVSVSYVDTLIMLRLSSLPGSHMGAEVFPVLFDLCSLGERIQTQISAGSRWNTAYVRLLLTILKVMDQAVSPQDTLPPEEARLLQAFADRRLALTTTAHEATLTALQGTYDAQMLKILAHLQIHLAAVSGDVSRCKDLLDQSTRILWRYFSDDPLSDFAEELADAFLSLSRCCLALEDLVGYEDALEKWASVAMSVSRQAIKTAQEQCCRYPDELHADTLRRTRYRLTANWSEYCGRLWLRELYKFKSNIDLLLSLYRSNIRHGINMSLPTEVINIRSALVLVKKIMELEGCFEDSSLSDRYRKTLPTAFQDLLVTTLEVLLLSEQSLSEDSADILSTPRFYYPKTAAFVESYIRRFKERNLRMDSDTVLQLSQLMAQLKLKAAVYSQEDAEDELWEVLALLDTLTDMLPPSPIPSGFLFDEVSPASVQLLQCRAYLLLGAYRKGAEDPEMAAFCYRQACQLCAVLHSGNTKNEASRYLTEALFPLLECYDRLDAEEEYRQLWDLIKPLLDD